TASGTLGYVAPLVQSDGAIAGSVGLCPRHGLVAQEAFHGGDAEGGVGGAVACIVASALHDLEKEPFAERFGIGLHELAVSIAVVKKVQRLEFGGKIVIEIEARLQIVVIVWR